MIDQRALVLDIVKVNSLYVNLMYSMRRMMMERAMMIPILSSRFVLTLIAMSVRGTQQSLEKKRVTA